MLYITEENLNQGIKSLQKMIQQDVLYIDTETSGLNPFEDKLRLITIYDGEEYLVFNTDILDKNIIRYIVMLLSGGNCTLVGHNLKFDIKFLYANSGVLLDKLHDTMNTEVIINTNPSDSRFPSLGSLVIKYCGVQLNKAIRESFYTDNSEINQEQLLYAIEDVKYLPAIHQKQLEEAFRQKQTKVVNLEDRLLPVVISMEINGIKLDKDEWVKLSQTAAVQSEEIAKKLKSILIDKIKGKSILEVFELFGIIVKSKKRKNELEGKEVSGNESLLFEEINFNSSLQVKKILSFLGIQVESTEEKELEEYKGNEFIDLLLEYRGLKKLVTTYGEKFLENINKKTGRVHSEFNQLAARSGRFSSSNPNLQNIPRRAEYRRPFVAEDGYVIIDIDYSQQEYRLAGAISKEPAIINAYKIGKDMHTATASLVFKIPMENVTKEQRNKAKGYNFGILYGANKYGLSYALGCSVDDADEVITAFYSGYPVLSKFKSAFEAQILDRGYSTTVLGRKRFFERKFAFSSENEKYKYTRSLTKQGFNHLIQGTGADILKQALCNIYYNNPFGDKLKIIGTVHDEILIEAKEEYADEIKKFVEEQMLLAEQPYLGEIPAVVESSVEKYWAH